MSDAAVTETMTPVAPAQLWRPDARGWAARVSVLALIFLGVVLVTAISPDYWADRIALAAVFAVIGLSLNIILGYAGQVSLGHHAFVGLSAFISALVVTKGHQSFWVGLIAAILVGAVSAGLLGLVALRIRGLYLALITLVYGFVAVNSLFELPALTQGGAGLEAPRPAGFTGGRAFAYLCMVFLAIAIFIDWRILRSKVGRALLAVKHSENVAASYAVNTVFYKVFAFVLSGAFAGLAGSLFAHRSTTVVANDFDFQIALLWVLMVVVGGLGNRTGIVIASAFFALFPFLITLYSPLNNFIEDTLHRGAEEFRLVIGALLALLTITLYPGGIAEQISPITRWLRGERFSMHPDTEPRPRRVRLSRRPRYEGKHTLEAVAEAAEHDEISVERHDADTQEATTGDARTAKGTET
jgi:branched-chain amino acid transport system permease protein